MGWLQLHLVAARDRVTALEEALLAVGAVAVTLGDHRDTPILEPGVGETPLWPEVELSALFEEDSDPGRIHAALDAMPGISHHEPRWEHLEDRAWEREWLQYFEPLRFGKHLWICPGGMTVPDPDATVLHLDPGLAFGTGTHPSTALCLGWLADNPPLAADVIDYGCGSGILGIAALLLGAAQVRAIDIDPQALLATRSNASRNAIDPARLEVGTPQAIDTTTLAGLLLANILAGPLIELAPQLVRMLSPGGTAILSGVLREQADAVSAAWLPWFEQARIVERDGWCRIELLGARPLQQP